MRAWILTQLYTCPETGWLWPVCSAYGDHPVTIGDYGQGAWALCRMNIDFQHKEAMKLDPRCLYIGNDFDAPPQQMLDLYPHWLTGTYTMMGQCINQIAKWEPAYLCMDDGQ